MSTNEPSPHLSTNGMAKEGNSKQVLPPANGASTNNGPEGKDREMQSVKHDSTDVHTTPTQSPSEHSQNLSTVLMGASANETPLFHAAQSLVNGAPNNQLFNDINVLASLCRMMQHSYHPVQGVLPTSGTQSFATVAGNHFPPQQDDQKRRFYCRLCKTSFAGVNEVVEHITHNQGHTHHVQSLTDGVITCYNVHCNRYFCSEAEAVAHFYECVPEAESSARQKVLVNNGDHRLVDPTLLSPQKQRQPRTQLTHEQLACLNRSYALNKHPKAGDIDSMVNVLGLSPRVIKVWFQNRRAKEKRESGKLPVSSGDRYESTDINGLPVKSEPCDDAHQDDGINSSNIQLTTSAQRMMSNNAAEATLRRALWMTPPFLNANPATYLPQRPPDSSERPSLGILQQHNQLINTTTFNAITSQPPVSVPTTTEAMSSTSARRRQRIKLTDTQLRVMRSIFNEYPTPHRSECQRLGESIGIAEPSVRIWYQNARAKQRDRPEIVKEEIDESMKVGDRLNDKYPNGPWVNNGTCSLCRLTYGPNTSDRDHLFSKEHLIILLSIQNEVVERELAQGSAQRSLKRTRRLSASANAPNGDSVNDREQSSSDNQQQTDHQNFTTILTGQ
ncbi:hypothetical protein ACOME3_000025 [Neoechinorhynchus agilis]